MSALIKACLSFNAVKNTGHECNESMGPTAMLFLIPPDLVIAASSLNDFYTYLNTQIHADKATRIFPLFGPSAPIRKITNNKESDVTVTLDDGTTVFIRYGVYNRVWGCTDGGLCYAETLQSFLKSGYALIEVDNAGQVLMCQNADGTYRGLKTTFLSSPSPDIADFKTPGFTYFGASYTPTEYVKNGVILAGDDTITSLVGLLDVDLILTKTNKAAAPGVSSTTKLKFNIITDCAQTDLIAKLGSPLAAVANFYVEDNAVPGTPVTCSAAAIVSGHMELTGTFVSGHTYNVKMAASSVLLTNLIDGYEGINTLAISIP